MQSFSETTQFWANKAQTLEYYNYEHPPNKLFNSYRLTYSQTFQHFYDWTQSQEYHYTNDIVIISRT